MINASIITKAVETLLINGLKAKAHDYKVSRGKYVNMNPEFAPWVGIYRGSLDYDTATLGYGLNSWKALFEIKIIVQASSIKSGEQAEERLENYIKDVLDVIMVDKTLGGSVSMINSASVEYSYNEVESESLYFQNAEITIGTEVRTQ